MSCFKVCQDTCAGYTQLSNRFIDDYMADANDAQLKVYLYLTRMLYANKPTSVADIADRFNFTEKDVSRSLKYWDKLGLISLRLAQDRTIESVQINNLEQLVQTPDQDAALSAPEALSAAICTATSVFSPTVSAFEKPDYTAAQLKEFRKDDTTSRILFIAEPYLQKTLSANEISTMLFISDKLGFSVELIDYLIEYCVENGKKRMSYIEATAIDWAQHDIKTQKQADIYVKKYDGSVYDIMHALGKNSSPACSELKFINKWTKEYGFSFDVINVACERTVLTTDKHRFEYADGILTNWYNAGVHSTDDIDRQDVAFRSAAVKKISDVTAPSSVSKVSMGNGSGKFGSFKQRDYDFSKIENLVSN